MSTNKFTFTWRCLLLLLKQPLKRGFIVRRLMRAHLLTNICLGALNISARPAIIAPALALPQTSRQDTVILNDEKPHLNIHGYLQFHVAQDTRQIAGLWAKGFLLAPQPYTPDHQGCDKSEQGQFTMVHTTSVFGCDSGPLKVGHARLTGKCYGNFLGLTANAPSSLADLGHQKGHFTPGIFTISVVYANIDWPNASLRIGHDPHPFYPTQAPPLILSGNVGLPFVPAVLNPQIKFTYTHNGFFVNSAVYSQLLYTDVSEGDVDIVGIDFLDRSPTFLYNSGLPALSLMAGYQSQQKHTLWLAANARRIRPALSLEETHPSQNPHYVTSIQGSIFGYLHTPQFDVAGQITGGDNGIDLISLGGYAVDKFNLHSSQKSYRNLRFVALWGNVNVPTKTFFSAGIFGGYARNLGSSKELYVDPATKQPIVFEYPITNLAWHLKDITRASTYFRCNWNPMEVALECEWTRARWGKKLDQYAVMINNSTNCQAVTNLHIELVTKYTF